MRQLHGGRFPRAAFRGRGLRNLRAHGADARLPRAVEGFQLPVTVREARYAGGSVLTYAVLPDGEEAVATSEGRLSDALTPGSTAYLYWNPAQAAVIGGTSHGA